MSPPPLCCPTCHGSHLSVRALLHWTSPLPLGHLPSTTPPSLGHPIHLGPHSLAHPLPLGSNPLAHPLHTITFECSIFHIVTCSVT
ncbi:hypothetical protein PAXRUDRAFT_781683 [Paxillus rubicundulus Ve08.2h10]|uniref:Unplaced genomic scaffold scaffold_2668, whole genome shotgun sequence n=1 Tax=Paxillus rubicundulus Ve08.2h10 TaxID=930991 RepID=A0A0D0CMF3_9AGAM|nr:hypothetical protein PAXRUDRAFT_781683 [Paxillus rubicundulus Ve08.2h10]